MIVRKSFLPRILILLLSAFISTQGVADQRKVFRIGVIKIAAHAALDADEKGFEAGLASAGFKEGVNVIYDRQNAQGDMGKANAIAKKFVDQQVDLIHSIATPTTKAVMDVAKEIPVVFSSITDPVGSQIVPSHSAPGMKTGTNLTGVSDLWPVFLQMQTYAKFVPEAKRWGTIYNPAEPNSVLHVTEMRKAAKELGLTLVEAIIASTKEVPQAAASLVGKVDAVAITSDNTAVVDLESIVKVCNENKIPLFAGDVDSVPRGAVAAYGLDYYLVGYSAGKKAVLILKGTKPGDIPWGPVEKFSLVINEKAAAEQGVVLSPELLKRADKVIR
ncbi:MAG: ABC transporter substrate-binding protein [Gammaproteobacteria bacterium]|nr:ABC transporter substrate-binding protein [Gammaproteobacteria bacterium]